MAGLVGRQKCHRVGNLAGPGDVARGQAVGGALKRFFL